MAQESTNDWVIKNKIALPHYDVPFGGLVEQIDPELPKLNMVKLELYKGATKKAVVTYFVSVGATTEEDEAAMWDAVNKAKTEYLEERYG